MTYFYSAKGGGHGPIAPPPPDPLLLKGTERLPRTRNKFGPIGHVLVCYSARGMFCPASTEEVRRGHCQIWFTRRTVFVRFLIPVEGSFAVFQKSFTLIFVSSVIQPNFWASFRNFTNWVNLFQTQELVNIMIVIEQQDQSLNAKI